MIVQTRPAKGYASVSTVNMDFLNLGLRMLEETQMRLLSVAAPFAPMDGMNEKGLCVAVLMIQDSPGFQQDTGKPDLTTTTAVRLLLDQAVDVEEAVELLSQYDLHASAGMMVHFDLADATGHSRKCWLWRMRSISTCMTRETVSPLTDWKNSLQ